MTTVLITGGTGIIGKSLTAALLARQYRVIVLSRDSRRSDTVNLSYAGWDMAAQTIDKEAIEGTDYIVHLAGAGIADQRWSNKRKKEIISSRVKSSALIIRALEEIPNKVKAVISASAIGWYGADPVLPNPRPFTENDPAADDFLGQTCQEWENSIEPILQSGKRLVKIRIGIVLSKKGGALAQFKRPLNFGLSTVLGSGKQIISWIHINDLIKIFLKAIEDDQVHGVFNAVAPQPVSNKAISLELASEKNKRLFITVHVPSVVLKTILGELSAEVLKSATVSSEKIQEQGFIFEYPRINGVFEDLL